MRTPRNWHQNLHRPALMLLLLGLAGFLSACAKDRQEAPYRDESFSRGGIEEAVEEEGRQPDYPAMARQLMEREYYDLALALLDDALAATPKKPELHFLRGVCYREIGKTGAAGEAFRHALKLDPKFAPAHDGLGLLCVGHKDWQEAREHFAEAARLNPGVAAYQNNLGYLCLCEDDAAGAAECFRKSLAIDPEFGLAAVNLGVALARQGRPKESLEAFIRVMPPAAAYNNLGVCLEETGSLHEALICYERALEEEPGLQTAAENLDRLKASLREGSEPQRENES